MQSIAFIGLNALDAWLTGHAIAMGATELNPLMRALGDSISWKVFLAVAVVLGVRFWGKEQLLLPLCLGMAGVVVWNLSMCSCLHLGVVANTQAQMMNAVLQQLHP